MRKDSKIYVADHQSLAGSAILRALKTQGYENVIIRTQSQLNLLSQDETEAFFRLEEPEYVFLTAEKAEQVHDHSDRGDILYENLMIQNNVIHQAYKSGVKKLLFVARNNIYPIKANEPVSESSLLTSSLDFNSEPYAIAKITGIKLCQNYNLQYNTNNISLASSILYGPEDDFKLESAHILPSIIRRFHLGKCLEENNWDAIRKDLEKNPIEGVGGTALKEDILHALEKSGIESSTYVPGENQDNIDESNSSVSVGISTSTKSRFDFLWSDDLANACIYLMERIDSDNLIPLDSKVPHNPLINIGTGKEIDIWVLVKLIKKVIGYQGKIIIKDNLGELDSKLTNISKLHSMGWKHKIEIKEGIKTLYEWYLRNE